MCVIDACGKGAETFRRSLPFSREFIQSWMAFVDCIHALIIDNAR
jgi:hypothetical protein